MQVRPSPAAIFLTACVLGGAVASAAPEALAGNAQASTTPQTHPSVRPKVGQRHSTFELTFTLTQAPGRTGLVDTSYREEVSPPARVAESCSPTQPASVVAGRQGATIQIPLHPPSHGWCRGRYDVTVFLERAPVCGPPIAIAAVVPCPLSPGPVPTFRVSELNTGDTHFTVR